MWGNTLKSFFKSLFLDHDGKPSFSRIGSALILLSCIFWISFITIRFSHIPENAQGVLLGTAAILTALYSANAVTNSIASNGDNK